MSEPQTTRSADTYFALPFNGAPERAQVVSEIMRGMCKFPALFVPGSEPCDTHCMQCPSCYAAMAAVASTLVRPDVLLFEIWQLSLTDTLVGVAMLERIRAGEDGQVHIAMWDGRLRDKRAVLQELIEWTFANHEGWQALHRVTLEVPDYAFALGRFAQRYLHFGGPFTYRAGGTTLQVEGVRRNAVSWRGSRRDLLLMGRINPEQREQRER